MKPLMTSAELVEHMKEKGIGFNIVNEQEAIDFLENHNYYLKLASYRFNYQKRPDGKRKGQYIGLEFAYLKELSTIDRHLRTIVLEMCLDIEHFLKVRLLSSIENNPEEDGYNIIQKFLSDDIKFRILKTLKNHGDSAYCRDLVEKYYPYFPAWVFVELISFGELAHLCSFYNDMYGVELCPKPLLNSVRDIRNAAAHSSCLINHLYSGDNNPDPNVVRMVKTVSGSGTNAVDKKMKNKCIYDFSCLLLSYDLVVMSPAAKENQYKKLHSLFDDRMIRNKEWFKGNSTIKSAYLFTKKFVDNVAP